MLLKRTVLENHISHKLISHATYNTSLQLNVHRQFCEYLYWCFNVKNNHSFGWIGDGDLNPHAIDSTWNSTRLVPNETDNPRFWYPYPPSYQVIDSITPWSFLLWKSRTSAMISFKWLYFFSWAKVCINALFGIRSNPLSQSK
jgi:hypothetical protein